MAAASCPQCGAEIAFRSAALPVRVCARCQTLVIRTDTGVIAVGHSATLPFDVSPIILGTTGKYEGIGFEVIGRVRWGYPLGSWNEWLVQFVDGGTGWLAEASGAFMLTQESAGSLVSGGAAEKLAHGGEVIVGDQLTYRGEALRATDIKTATCIASEGELPFKAVSGWSIYSVDFKSTGATWLSAQRDGDDVTFYAGRYVTLADLHAANLRAIEGWAMPRYTA